MHPVEATLYYSAALIPVALGLHPVSLFILVSFSFILRFLCGTSVLFENALLSDQYHQDKSPIKVF